MQNDVALQLQLQFQGSTDECCSVEALVAQQRNCCADDETLTRFGDRQTSYLAG